MKIVLKNGATYPVKRSSNNIADPSKIVGYIDTVPEDVKSVYVSDIVLDTELDELSDLFQIEKDFSADNISEVTFVTDAGSELKDSYNAVGKISQNITDYVNETMIVLVKFK